MVEIETRSVEGTTVVVTGASAGIGAATALVLGDAGANVVLGARRQDRLDALVAEIGPERAVARRTDVSDPEENRALVRTGLERFGRIDSLVANAGIGSYGGILDRSDEDLARMMTTNIAGTVWAIRAAVPAMLEAGGGDIVITASVAGLRGGPNEAVYAATKFAQVGLAGSIDRELRAKGIRVTTICPAATATEFAMGTGRTPDMPELDDWIRSEDVASAILFVLRQPRRMRTTQWQMWSAVEAS